MNATRREFGLMAASSLLFSALPIGRLLAQSKVKLPAGEVIGPFEHSIDPEVTVDSKVKGQVKAKANGKTHEKAATTATYLSDGIDRIGFGKPSEQDYLPKDGQMAALIDYKGNWVFSGGFPAQNMLVASPVAVGLGLKSSIGQVIAFTAHGIVPASGTPWSFSKQGHSPVVEDLWKDVVKGHKFHGYWSAEQIRAASKGGSSGGGGGSSDVVSDVEAGLTLFGTILAFL